MITIDTIDKQTFHQLFPATSAPGLSVGEEADWFADHERNIIGTVGFDRQNKRGWNYIILRCETPTGFEVCDRQEQLFTRQTASQIMLHHMVEAEMAAEQSGLVPHSSGLAGRTRSESFSFKAWQE